MVSGIRFRDGTVIDFQGTNVTIEVDEQNDTVTISNGQEDFVFEANGDLSIPGSFTFDSQDVQFNSVEAVAVTQDGQAVAIDADLTTVENLLDNHSSRHETGGADELDVTGLSGDLADAQDPKTHDNSAHSVQFANTAGDTFTGDIDMDSNSITTLANPSDAFDAATKAYVDGVAEGLDVKKSVRVGTANNIDISSNADPNPVDGVSLNDGDRILLKAQDDARENGIYVANTAIDPTTWTRASDFDDDEDVTAGAFTFCEEGDQHADFGFIVTADGEIEVGVDDIVITTFSRAGLIFPGNQLEQDGNTFNVLDGSGSGLDADFLDGEEVTFTSPADEEIVIFDAESGEWKNADPGDTLIQKFDQDITVTVGASGDFGTLNAALEALTDQYPQYTQAEGQRGGFTAVVRLLDDYVMSEQVLVDGIHLDWIRIETTRGSSPNDITAIDEGQVIPGFSRAQESTFSFRDINPDEFYVDNTNSDLDGQYIALGTANANTGSETYYFWFNVVDVTDIPTVSSNAGDPQPSLSGNSVTGIQVDINLLDSPAQVASNLESAISNQVDLNVSLNGRILTVTDQDGGLVSQSPLSSTQKITTVINQPGTTPDIATQSESVIDITTDSSNWLIDRKLSDGVEVEPTLKLVRGETYEFDIDAQGDPFRITTVDGPYDPANEYTDGVTGAGTEVGTLVWQVPNNAPSILYYYSENNAVKEGNITIVDEAPIAEVTGVEVTDYTVEAFQTAYLEDEFVTLQDAQQNDFYFWFNVGESDTSTNIIGSGSDPGLQGTGSEIPLSITDDGEDAANALRSSIDALSNVSASRSGFVVTSANNTDGPSQDSTSNSPNILVRTSVAGRNPQNLVEVTTSSPHGFTAGDRIVIRNHNSGVEEFDYNGSWVVRGGSITSNTFELQFSDNPAAVYNPTRAANPATAEVVSPEPVPVVASALTEQWEFFYQPAFGVARGSLPTIDCVFDMDDSDGQSYQSYYDGLCATDRGHINITPFSGFINAAGSNIYATRSSIINANDAVASGAGRMGVWAYSNSIINARRVTATDCGLVGASDDVGDGFDTLGRPIGNCINATRGSLVNAEGATVGGAQSDNVYASYGGMINLGGHDLTPTFTSSSVNGQDINIDGGMVTRQDGTQFDSVQDVSGKTMLQGVVDSGQVTLTDNVAEVATGINTTDATFMLALGIDDPDADAEVAGALYWDDSGDEYEIRIRETETDVNPTVNYDIIRVR